MKLTIISPRGVLFTKEVDKVTLPGANGEFTVLPHHASIVSQLAAGAISFEESGAGEQQVEILSGYVQVDHACAEVYAELK